MRKTMYGVMLGFLCCWATSSASAATIDFEAPTFPLGTAYGPPGGHAPGDHVFTVWDVHASVHTFTLGGFVGFNGAQIVDQPTSFFPPAINATQVLQFNNINMQFDFTDVPQDVIAVSFDYADLGGDENFDLNFSGRQEIPMLSAIAPVAGFTINVAENAILGGVGGRVTIVADPGNKIELLVIGGQELAIDNVTKQVLNAADFDGDGDVDGDDFLQWQASFGVDDGGDADGDGDTDGDDFLIWQSEFGNGDGNGTVPEPSAILLGLVMAFAYWVVRKR